eukprot:364079-Chlamydomonas_euryale.AAC.1
MLRGGDPCIQCVWSARRRWEAQSPARMVHGSRAGRQGGGRGAGRQRHCNVSSQGSAHISSQGSAHVLTGVR